MGVFKQDFSPPSCLLLNGIGGDDCVRVEGEFIEEKSLLTLRFVSLRVPVLPESGSGDITAYKRA